jgi:hypothetical protein
LFSLKGGDNDSGGTWNGGGAPPATGSGSIDSGPGGSGRAALAPTGSETRYGPVTAGTKDTTPPPLPPITHPSQLSPYSLYGAIGNSAGDFIPLGADFSSFGR